MAATERCKSIPISTNISIVHPQPHLISTHPISLFAFLFMDLPLGYGFQLPLRPFPSSFSLPPLLRFSHFPLSNDAAVSVFGFGRHRHRVTFAVFRLHLLQLPRPFPPRPAWLVVCCLIVCPEDIKSIAARQEGAGGGQQDRPSPKSMLRIFNFMISFTPHPKWAQKEQFEDNSLQEKKGSERRQTSAL